MENKVILNSKEISIIIDRLCHELIEGHSDFSNTILIGLQPRGVYLCERIRSSLESINSNLIIENGSLDITFYRDDFRRRETPLIPSVTNIDFSIENKNIVLVDDVLFTGRTIRSGLDALLSFGRPKSVELLVLIDRRFRRDLPIDAVPGVFAICRLLPVFG